MQYKLIIFTLLVSVLIHLGLIILFGNIEIDLSYFDFIDAYIVKNENPYKISQKAKAPLKDTNTIEQKVEGEETGAKENIIPNGEEVRDLVENSTAQSLGKIEEEKSHSFYHERLTKFINERMRFDVYWMGIYAGSAYVFVEGNSETIKITSEVKSASFISNFYYVHDKAESNIESGKPKYFRLIQIEGKHRGDKEIKFDYDSGEIIFINNIKNKMSIHKGIDKVFMDVLSGFFYLRTLSMSGKDSIYIDIFDSDKFATVEIKVLREEKIETYDGKEISALLIKPELTTEGLFKRKGDIFIWISNDDKKIPLRIETKVPVGKITAELKEYKKN